MNSDNLAESALDVNSLDANSKVLIPLPEVFDSVVGEASYSARTDINASVSRLHRGELEAEIFVKKIFDAIDSVTTRRGMPGFALGYDEVMKFAQDVISKFPPPPVEPETESSQPYVPPIKWPDPVVPFPPPRDWIDNLRLDDLVRLPMVPQLYRDIKNALYSYCHWGNRDSTESALKKAMLPYKQVYAEIDGWLERLDRDREKYFADEKIKVEKEKNKIKETFQKKLAVLDNMCRAGQLSASDYDEQVKSLGAEVKIKFKELEGSV